MLETRRERTLLSLTITVVSAALIFYLAILPTRDHVNDLRQRIATEHRLLQENRAVITRKGDFQSHWTAINDHLEGISVEDQQNECMDYLETAGAEGGLVFDKLDPLTTSTTDLDERYVEIIFEVSFSSDLNRLARFIMILDAAERLLRTEKMTIEKNNTQSIDPLTVKLTLSTVAEKPPTVLDGVSAQ